MKCERKVIQSVNNISPWQIRGPIIKPGMKSGTNYLVSSYTPSIIFPNNSELSGKKQNKHCAKNSLQPMNHIKNKWTQTYAQIHW